MSFNPIRVLIVDESRTFGPVLREAISGDHGVQVVGVVSDPKEAKRFLEEFSADAVVLKAEQRTARTTELLAFLDPDGNFPFIIAGAQASDLLLLQRKKNLDYVRLPDPKNKNDFSTFCSEICVKVKILTPAAKRIPQAARPSGEGRHIIAIGASTGGTEATAEIIKQLPPTLPGILIVQHMPPGFTKMYADRLNTISKLKVTEAEDGDRVLPGTALVAAGGKHMILKRDTQGYYVKCAEGERVNGHCPSVGVLFESVAAVAGPDAVGVILTGMGKDGAEGLLKMREAGAFTVGQDRESCVVYGMPMVAKDIGAVAVQAPCKDIAGILIRQFP
jgi:two-component system chemotaxis response regulator CheB